ncbi:uroporphyrinogen decarboxylase-like [Gordionus sp. m RMFG-2023]|uniref:uroporphyrinogen decarboxylase-like n=1 Tax=Gordionus sp. m RMFG-2023 TaxID=3053472 RepID=UPI0031FC3F82
MSVSDLILQIFESHAECMNKQLFQRFSIPYLKAIANVVKSSFDKETTPPLILFAKGVQHSLSLLNSLGYDVISLDWTLDPEEAKKILGPNIVLQGNLDPSALFSSKEALQNLTTDMISRFGTKGYIANLGHGIYPETPIENVSYFIEAVHSYPTNL